MAKHLAASAVVIAAPTDAASRILKGLSDQFAPTFARIEYAPVAVVSAGYRREQIQQPINGFGFLVPRTEGLRVLGTVFGSSLFPGRAPEGMACFTSFAGGATDPKLCDMSENEIAETITGEVARVLRGISGETSHHRRPSLRTCVAAIQHRPLPNRGSAKLTNVGHPGTVSCRHLFDRPVDRILRRASKSDR